MSSVDSPLLRVTIIRAKDGMTSLPYLISNGSLANFASGLITPMAPTSRLNGSRGAKISVARVTSEVGQPKPRLALSTLTLGRVKRCMYDGSDGVSPPSASAPRP